MNIEQYGTIWRNALPLIKWTKWFIISLTIVLWLGLSFWIAGQVVGAILMFAIAALLAYALYPLVKLVQRFLPRSVAILVVFISIFSLLCALLYLLISVAIQQVTALIHYIQEVITSPGSSPFTLINETLRSLGFSQEQIKSVSLEALKQLQGFVRNAVPLLTSTFGIVIDVLLVAALCVYMMFAGPGIVNWLRYKTPLSQRDNVNFLLDTFKNVAGGYIRGQLLLSTVLSSITGIFMGIIGVPLSLFLAVLSFVLSFIPTIGAFITGIICVLLALTQGWITTLLAVAFLIFLQLLETQVLSPRIVGSAVGLHPLAALMALIIGGELFGPLGALFAAPITGIIQALLLAVWSTWRKNHPEQFRGEDDAQLSRANELEEKGSAS